MSAILISKLERCNDAVVMLRNVGKDAVRTFLQRLAIALDKFRSAGTIWKSVERTVAEKTIYFVDLFMARVISTVDVFKESVRIIHCYASPANARTCRRTLSAPPDSTDNTSAEIPTTAARLYDTQTSVCQTLV